MNLAASATYFAYKTISSGLLILYRTLTQTCVIEVLTPKYLCSDHYSTRGPIFSENNSPADQIFREFWSPGPKFSPDQISVTGHPYMSRILPYAMIRQFGCFNHRVIYLGCRQAEETVGFLVTACMTLQKYPTLVWLLQFQCFLNW